MKETYIPRHSESLAQAEYDSDARTLDVTFQNGDQWRYDGVPQEVFLGLQNAPSAGSFFYRQIRSRFPGAEI